MSERVTSGAIRALPGDHAYGFGELFGWGVLEQEPARAGTQGFEHVLVEPKVVTTITGGPSAAAIRRVASMPSMPGMRMSMSTTSAAGGGELDGGVTVGASPTTSRSGSASRIMVKPRRISASSSAMSTRMVIGP
jgi:hypothetical protein